MERLWGSMAEDAFSLERQVLENQVSLQHSFSEAPGGIADDGVAVLKGGTTLEPGIHTVRLSRVAATFLKVIDKGGVATDGSGKLVINRQTAPEWFQEQAANLHSIYWIDREPGRQGIRFKRICQSSRLMKLMRSSFCLFASSKLEQGLHVQRLFRLMGTVPLHVLSFPRSFEQMGYLCEEVEHRVSKTEAEGALRRRVGRPQPESRR